MYALTLERNEEGTPRVIIFQGEYTTSAVIKGRRFRGTIIQVAEHRDARIALEFAIKDIGLQNQPIGILTHDSQVDFPDEISIIDAAQVYFNIF